MKKHIPNTITCCNLICGCIATRFALMGLYELALYWIIGGAVFDFFDGFAARLLGVSSGIGKELDSLADDITFGAAPAAIVFSLIAETWPNVGEVFPALTLNHTVNDYIPYVAFLIAAFSALRLAKFNLDERQSLGFIGLPTPANALFWAALTVSAHDWLLSQPLAALCLIAGVFVSSWILVSEIPMFALKFKTYGLQNNEVRYAFIVASIGLLVALRLTAIPFIIGLYVVTSLLADALKG